MAEKINLAEQLKKYFGFDTFKGNQEAIISVVLSVTFFVNGRDGYSYISAHCSYEKSG